MFCTAFVWKNIMPINSNSTPRRSGPGILDAVRDQHGCCWVSFGTPDTSIWVTIADFTKADVFARLANIDPRCVDPGFQRELRSEVSRQREFRAALVATAPGWLDGHFVLGDGRVLSPANPKKVIVVFNRNPKFARREGLIDWQGAVGPIVAEQPLALFALALSFVGPLLPFAPADYLSPQYELVGPPGCGKSSLGVFAASVWAGDPQSGCGGGETWNRTPHHLDTVKLAHRHSLLLLDEANLGGTAQQRREMIHRVVFGMADTGQKQRMGDTQSVMHASLAVLSTTNRPLAELAEGSAAEIAAMRERMITVRIAAEDRPLGILDHLPLGFDDASAAVEALRTACNLHWGAAGQRFARRLVSRDAAQLSRFLAKQLDAHRRSLATLTPVPRHQKSLAIVMAAGQLAQRWGIIPEAWGSPVDAVLAVARSVFGASVAPTTEIEQVRSYARRKARSLRRVRDLDRPLDREEFDRSPGFWRQTAGQRELLIPAVTFQREFPNHRDLMSALRQQGKARTEAGQNPKLTIKTPRSISLQGRVYCISLSD